MASLVLALNLLAAAALLPSPIAPVQTASTVRSRDIVMKGRPSRGMPKKATMQPGSMVNTGVKKRMMDRDFQDRKEWAKVGKVSDLVPTLGSAKAVEAGRAPGSMTPTGFREGAMYIWCLVRGEPTASDADAGLTDKVFAIDGACRTCQFPLTQAQYSAASGTDPQAVTCGCCGTKYSLETGETIDFLPGNNPVRWVAKQANEKKGPQRLASLPTRISKSGNIFVRLPDNTIME